MRILDSVPIMGLWNLSDSGFHAHLSSREAKNIIKKAYRIGIRMFDTAFSYNEADSLLYSAMKEAGKDAWSVISKIMPVPTFRKKAEISLSRLHRDRFSILLIHWPCEEENLYKSLRELEKMKDEGKADAIGVSNFPYSLLEKAARDFPIEYHERPLSLIWTKDYGKEKESGMKILAYSPLGMGILSGKYSSASDFSDSRKNLYLFSSPYTEQLLELLRNNPSIALSWTYMQRPFGVISGFSSEDDIDVLNKIKPLDDNLYSTLSDLSAKIIETAFSDNLFAHRWN